MTTKQLLTAWLLTLTVGAQAQPAAPRGEAEYQYADAMQLWRLTESAAGLAADTMADRGRAELRMDHRSGDYHRVQEGRQTNELHFFTESYRHIGAHLYGYGRFDLTNGRTAGRAWSDDMRTYLSNPFLSGSSVAGRYDFQDFDLTARVGSVGTGPWHLGLGLDYKVGDLSRLRDPRSRARMLDYRLTPSATRSWGRHTVGLAAWYRRYKEKLPSLITVQNSPGLLYYQMTGLEAATGTAGAYAGYSREYVDHEAGGELEYAYVGAGLRSVTALGMTRGTERMFETYKREPGRYVTYTYRLRSHLRLVRPRRLHQLDLEAEAGQAYADEYRPTLVITTDSVHGYNSFRYDNLFTYRKRYQMEQVHANLHYRLSFTRGAAVRRYADVGVSYADVTQKHLMPDSRLRLTTTTLRAESGQSLLASGRLWLTAHVGWLISQRSDLTLGSMTDYATHVLLPDMAYYDANCFTAGLAVRYQRPVSLKGYRWMAYAELRGQTHQAQHGLDATTAGLTLGIYY